MTGKGSLKRCKYCGRTTRKNTLGTPNAPCPERGGGMMAQHVYENIPEP